MPPPALDLSKYKVQAPAGAGGAPNATPAAPTSSGSWFSNLFKPFGGTPMGTPLKPFDSSAALPAPAPASVQKPLDLSAYKIGATPAAPAAPAAKPSFFSRLLGGAKAAETGINSFMEEAGTKTAEQWNQSAQKIGSSVTQGAANIETTPAGSAERAKAGGEAALGTASGAAQALWAPITGIIQTIADRASDSKAVQQFAEGTGPLMDLYDELSKKIDAAAKEHPEAAMNIGDAANVILSSLGGKTGAGKAALGTDVGAGSLKNAAVEAAAPLKGAPAGLEKILGNAVKTTQEAGANVKGAIAATTKGLGSKAGSLVSTPATYGFSQLFGIGPEHIPFIKQHPELFTPEAMKNASSYNVARAVSRAVEESRGEVPTPDQIATEVQQGLQRKMQALNEHAKLYSTLGNESLPGAPRKGIVVDQNWLRNQLENKDIAGVKIGKDGRVEYGDADSKIRPSSSPEGARRLQDIWDTWGPVFATGKMSLRQFLSFRQDLALAADYKGGIDTALNKSAHGIRDNFNKEYRPNVDGLDKLDKEHAALEKDLDSSITGLGTVDSTTGLPKIKMNEGAAGNIMNAVKDTKGELGRRLESIAPGVTKKVQQARDFSEKWNGIVDENGNLTENAINNIMNAANKGRDIRLEKLEEAVPGITQRIKQIKAIEDLNSSLGQKVGAYTRGVFEGGLLFTHPTLGLAAIATLNPKVGLAILRKLGSLGKGGAMDATHTGEAGFVKNPFFKGDEAVPIAEQPKVLQTIDRHTQTASQVMKKTGGDVTDHIAGLKQNIVLGLKAEGHPEAAQAVLALDAKKFTSPQAFQVAANKEALVEELMKREPGIGGDTIPRATYEEFASKPITKVAISKIQGFEDIKGKADMARRGLEQYREQGVDPQGAFHGARIGRKVELPVLLEKQADGTFTVVDGEHRLRQALINGDADIIALVK